MREKWRSDVRCLDSEGAGALASWMLTRATRTRSTHSASSHVWLEDHDPVGSGKASLRINLVCWRGRALLGTVAPRSVARSRRAKPRASDSFVPARGAVVKGGAPVSVGGQNQR